MKKHKFISRDVCSPKRLLAEQQSKGIRCCSRSKQKAARRRNRRCYNERFCRNCNLDS